MKPSLVICDKMDDVSDKLIKSGVPVLFVDNGNFDKELYPEVIPGNSFFDLNRFYAPFRTSWDEGNAATLRNLYFRIATTAELMRPVQ